MRPSYLRLVTVLAVPLVAAVTEVFHPKAPLAQLFSDDALLNRWLGIHVFQLFLFGALGVVIYLLVDGHQGLPASLTRLGSGAFAVIYGAYDGLAGIATGVLALNARGMPAAEAAVAARVAQDLFRAIEEGAYAWIGLLGAACWVFAVLAAAITLARPRWPLPALGLALLTAFASTFGKSEIWRGFVVVTVLAIGLTFLATAYGRRIAWPPLALLAISALALTSGHPAPFGTIAFGALWLAILWLELAPRRAAARANTAHTVPTLTNGS